MGERMNGGALLWILIALFWGAGVVERIVEARAKRRDRYWSVN
jgi:hypothetical protein